MFSCVFVSSTYLLHIISMEPFYFISTVTSTQINALINDTFSFFFSPSTLHCHCHCQFVLKHLSNQFYSFNFFQN